MVQETAVSGCGVPIEHCMRGGLLSATCSPVVEPCGGALRCDSDVAWLIPALWGLSSLDSAVPRTLVKKEI
ncbi:unnamed protein product [Gadus morhua 'NCC']